VHGSELFKKEGSSVAVLVKDIFPGSTSGVSSELVAMGNILYFAAMESGGQGIELWRSDGTEAGTYALSNISTNTIRSFVPVNNTLYFIADDLTFGPELWKSDGTIAGTMMVKNINPNAGSNINGLIGYKGNVYFGATDGVHGDELWRSDGTEAGTVMVKDIVAAGSGNPNFNGFVFKEKLYFKANTLAEGFELWVTDGTEAGTTLVKDLWVGAQGSNANNFTVVKDLLYFTAYTSGQIPSLFKTDGTAAGTIAVKTSLRITPDGTVDNVSMWAVKDMLYFIVNDYTANVTEISSTSGNAVCTLVTKSNFYVPYVLALGNKIFMGGESYEYGGRELYVYDATNDAVCRLGQTITFETLPTGKRANYDPFDLAATASSELPVTFTSSNTSVATISGKRVTLVGAGQTEITATQAGDETYAPATSVKQTLVVDVILGIETTDTKIASAYPNPFVGDFTLRIESALSSEARVRVFTTTGSRTEAHEAIATNTDHILGSSWPAGFYIAEIEVDGKRYGRKIIKK
jgi:ELWxxDGT repeat protein